VAVRHRASATAAHEGEELTKAALDLDRSEQGRTLVMKLDVVQSETTRRSMTTPTTYSLSPAQCSPSERTMLPSDLRGLAARCELRPASLSGECDGESSSGVVASGGVGGGERGDMGRLVFKGLAGLAS
jgi:hypothetical protein